MLKNINLSIESGEFIVFVGPSGSGKTTLLRCISGLESVSKGLLEIDGKVVNEVAPSERGIAMVFQSYALYPHKTVYENMAYALKIRGENKSEIDRKVLDAAQKLGLTDYLNQKPKALSGGQKQRVAIGRAIVREPKVFLFDEPLSNLDAALRVHMRMEISQLNLALVDTTMIYVTHDQIEAMTLADRIVVLKNGEIEQVGTPMELYEKPKTMFVATFIGSPKMNILKNEYAKPYYCDAIGVRPEHLEINDSGALEGIVVHSENLGADSFVFIDIGDTEKLIVRETRGIKYPINSRVLISVAPNKIYRFDGTGQNID